jgi:hypothetical protein
MPLIHTFDPIFTKKFRHSNVRKSASLHSRKSTPTSKFLGRAEAYFVCHIRPNFHISLGVRSTWQHMISFFNQLKGLIFRWIKSDNDRMMSQKINVFKYQLHSFIDYLKSLKWFLALFFRMNSPKC